MDLPCIIRLTKDGYEVYFIVYMCFICDYDGNVENLMQTSVQTYTFCRSIDTFVLYWYLIR